MNTVKILHCADIHIGAAESFLGSGADARRFEALLTFEKIIDLGIEQGVKLIAIAGDLFDSNRIEERFVTAVLEKIASAAPIRVIFAAGNHDPLNSDSPFVGRELPENLSVLPTADSCIELEELKVRVYGRSFENAYLKGEEQFALTPEDGYINILVQHGELKSDLGSDYNAITPKFVKTSGMDYIALGHVHKRSDIGRIENTFFAYCGCPEGQGFDELDEKGVYIGEVGKGICRLEFVPVSRRLHIHERLDITDCADGSEICALVLERLRAEYGDSFKDNLYKIELTGSIDPDTELSLTELESRLSESVYYLKLKDSTEYRIDLAGLSEEASLKGIFVKKLLERQDGSDEKEKELLQRALKLGLKAFNTEVKYSED